MAKMTVCILEEPSVVELLKRMAEAEGESLSVIYRRATRVFLSTLPEIRKLPQEPEQEAA